MFNAKSRMVREFIAGTIIALIISGLSLGVTIYNDWSRAPQGVCATETHATIGFDARTKNDAKTYETSKFNPCKGKVYIALNQKSGPTNTTYSVYTKKINAKSWTKVGTIKITTNNVLSKYKYCYTATNNSTYYVSA